MSEDKDARRLDDVLRGVVNTTRPVFDAEGWKQKHAAAYQALVSRGEGSAGGVAGRRARLMFGWLAVAAVVLIGVSVVVIWPLRGDEPGPTVAAPAVVGPARVVSMVSLRRAYRDGGEDGLGAQLDRALKDLGPRPAGLSMRELFEDLDS